MGCGCAVLLVSVPLIVFGIQESITMFLAGVMVLSVYVVILKLK